MACNDVTPCSDPCTGCNEYDNCGCLNPTTFECVTVPSDAALTSLGVTTDMNGKQVLAAINTSMAAVKDAEGKSLLDATDTCPDYLMNKLQPGLNISITKTGTGCDAKLVINSSTGGVAVDVNAKVSSGDTTSDYLYNKFATGTFVTKTIINPAGNEQLKLDVVPATLLSTDAGNMLAIGTDGKIKTSYSAPDGSETKITHGTGIAISGTGTTADPYVLSTNASIQVARSCFDGIWRPITLVATGNSSVVYVTGTPQYRYRFDGSIEFKGQLTYTVAYGAYSTSNRKFTITVGNIPTSCVTLTEQAGTTDMKAINYIDVPQASADQIVQQYGYIIRKSAQNLIIEFQSAFTTSTSKTVVVNFDGAVSHPNY